MEPLANKRMLQPERSVQLELLIEMSNESSFSRVGADALICPAERSSAVFSAVSLQPRLGLATDE